MERSSEQACRLPSPYLYNLYGFSSPEAELALLSCRLTGSLSSRWRWPAKNSPDVGNFASWIIQRRDEEHDQEFKFQKQTKKGRRENHSDGPEHPRARGVLDTPGHVAVEMQPLAYELTRGRGRRMIKRQGSSVKGKQGRVLESRAFVPKWASASAALPGIAASGQMPPERRALLLSAVVCCCLVSALDITQF